LMVVEGWLPKSG